MERDTMEIEGNFYKVNLLTSRLKKKYWPKDVMGIYNLADVLAARPVSVYVPESQKRREKDSFNLGRVHFFYNQLKAGKTLDRIDVRFSFFWDEIMLYDGHHRFAAYVLARKKYIPAVCVGSKEEVLYLMGR
jgi:hypothetical protein